MSPGSTPLPRVVSRGDIRDMATAEEDARIDELLRRKGWSKVPTAEQRAAQCARTKSFCRLCIITSTLMTALFILFLLYHRPLDDTVAAVSIGAGSSIIPFGRTNISRTRPTLQQGK